MSERELDLVCTTICCICLMILVGWMAYINKR